MSNNTMRELTPDEKDSVASPTPAPSVMDTNTIPRSEGSIRQDDSAVADDSNVEYASGLKLAAVVLALALSIFLVSLDMTIVATAIPKISDVSLIPFSLVRPTYGELCSIKLQCTNMSRRLSDHKTL
jgi:hypothetical protein